MTSCQAKFGVWIFFLTIFGQHKGIDAISFKKVIHGTNVKPQLPKAYERIISNEVCPSSKVTSHFGCKAQTRIFLGLGKRMMRAERGL